MDVQYTKQRRIQSRVEIVVDVSKPLDAKNFNFIIDHVVSHMLPTSRGGFDDAYFVEVRDDDLVIWWPEQDQIERIPPALPQEF